MQRPKPSTLARWMIYLVAWGAVLTLWWAAGGRDARVIRQMPASERERVYTREMENMRVLCDPAPDGRRLQGQCEDRARFLRLFPECREECRNYLQVITTKATR